MSGLVKLSPYLSLTAFVVAVGTAGINFLGGQPSDAEIMRGTGLGSPAVPRPGGGATRVMFPNHPGPDNRHDNHMVSLAYNWNWNPIHGWTHDDETKPAVALTVESWFHGLAELNYDMRPPQGETDWPGGRGFGFAALHDGTYSTLMVGGEPYGPGAAGVKFTGGLRPNPIISIFEPAERTDPEALRVERQGGVAGVSLFGGASPALAFGLSARSATEVAEGTLRVIGDPGTDPIVNLVGTGREATVLAVRSGEKDSTANLRIVADGRFEWSDGERPADVTLERSGTGRMSMQAEFEVPAIRIGGGAVLQSVQVLTVETTPPAVPGHGTRDHIVPLRGIPDTTLIFVNGPEQPNGLALAGARSDAQGRLVLRFVNASAESRRPASGRYSILVVVPGAS